MQDKISVIVPVYNREKYLERCLNSIINQTYENLEIILIDDGSQDSSLEICKRFKKRDERIKIIVQKNQGVSIARNNGLKEATGNYIGFVDSDDWIEKEMYDELYKLIHETKADVIAFPLKKKKYKNEITIFSNEKCICELFTNLDVGMSCCNKVFKKDIFEGVRFPDKIKIGEDAITMVQIFDKAKKFILKDTFFYHQEESENNCQSMYEIEEKYKVVEIYEEFILRYKTNERVKNTAINRYVIGIIGFFIATKTNEKDLKKKLKMKTQSYLFKFLFSDEVVMRYKLSAILVAVSPSFFNFMLTKFLVS